MYTFANTIKVEVNNEPSKRTAHDNTQILRIMGK